MRKVLLLLPCLFLSILLNAQEDEVTERYGEKVLVDGLSYYIDKTDNTAMIANGNQWTGELDIPEQIAIEGETYTVTRILWLAFDRCSTLTRVRIPKTVSEIKHYAGWEDCKNPFNGCTSLEAIEVDGDNPWMSSENGVLFNKDKTTLIAFPGLEVTESGTIDRDLAYIPSGVSQIARKAFPFGPGMVFIPSSIKKLDGAFTNCLNMRYLTVLATTPPVINDKTTFNTTSINDRPCKLIVPHGTKTAYQQADGWKDFENIEEEPIYPQGQYIYKVHDEDEASIVGLNSNTAFDGHAKIPATVAIDGKTYTVTNIENGAFNGDSRLLTVTIPKTLEYVDESAFTGCDQLYDISVEAGNSRLHSTDGMLFSIVFDYNTLAFCPPMQKQGNSITPRTKVTLPDETQVIGCGTAAFAENLLTVIIPTTVKRMESDAFKNSRNLTTVICMGSPPPSYTDGDHAFTIDVRNNATFYVPKGSIATYGNTWAYWVILKNAHVVEYDPAAFDPNSIEVRDPEEADDPEFYEPEEQLDEPGQTVKDGTLTSLIILFKDKTTQAFELADQPLITIAGTDLKVSARNADVTIPLSDIVRYTFQKRNTTGITETEQNAETVDYRDGVLTLSGLKAGSTVSLYALDGRLMQSKTVLHDGTFRHSLASLSQGIYIVKVNNLSYKIMKR